MKILIAEEIAEVGIHLLREEHQVDLLCGLSREQLIEIIHDYEALVVCGNTQVTKEILEAGTKLRVIGRAGAEIEHIDLQTATKKGIVVLNSPQGKSAAPIEYALSMLLTLSRPIPSRRSGKSSQPIGNSLVGVELQKKTLGIIGLGRVGTGVARRAKAFEMEVLAHDPFINEENARDLGVKLVDFDTLLERSDFITLHIPLTVDSYHIINREALTKMKRGVKLINCARGGLIDETALLEALRSGRVSGAALDDLEIYPPAPDYPLCTQENVLCTPHLAMATVEGREEVASNLARGILAALRSEPVATALNIPPVPRDVMDTIKPYLDLVEKMGILAAHLTEGRLRHFEVKYTGRISAIDTKMLTRAIIKGVLNPILQEAVNFVNAPEVAKARGITYKEVKNKEAESFVDLITLAVRTDQSEHRVAGTLFGRLEGRIVQIDNVRVDIAPRGWLLLIPHSNNPGMVGKVGTLLGDNGINISGMQVSATEDGAVNVMIVNTDVEPEQQVINKLKELTGILSVRKARLDLE